ncbi:hypothetical protein BZA05DRAFT_401049 [Tricharina praecox]|uniref:uncharacterized protein n=1 Tax=Tricharina praecox TaxID=43433 RepID=UPI002220AE19|nr:uncharacterized protein BZA05DRAFT_401049 [Tricharina praecox]KAI5850134.1 hypothetical protein BZA05DRAFT_401049 [Tricharina praecox]
MLVWFFVLGSQDIHLLLYSLIFSSAVLSREPLIRYGQLHRFCFKSGALFSYPYPRARSPVGPPPRNQALP